MAQAYAYMKISEFPHPLRGVKDLPAVGTPAILLF